MESLTFNSYNLNEEIIKAIDLLKYKKPTIVQEKVIPLVLDGKDVIVKSETGSGKTAAFGIPICNNIAAETKTPKALILTPTRELCVQIKEDITAIGRFKRIRCAAVFGKQPFTIQMQELKQRVNVIAGTPGRILDHVNRGTINLNNIHFLVIDEADKMLNMGFIEQVESIIKVLPTLRQTMLFSATMPQEIKHLCESYLIDPIEIEIQKEHKENIAQTVYRIDASEKFQLLKNLLYLEKPESCIIFCSRKENADRVYKGLKEEEFSVGVLHGGMLQQERLDTIKSFKKGEFRFLAATDVAGRGIDIEDLKLIINYDVPEEKESYIHRIGRTGRAGKSGKAITFITPREEKYIRAIEEYLGYEIENSKFPSKEDIEAAKKSFNESSKISMKKNIDKLELVNKYITKIYIGGGKKKKIRAGDIVGAILGIEKVSLEDIGIIDVQDNFSYVDILNGKGELVIDNLKRSTIKGKSLKVETAAK